jgi:hypothetical protein
MVEFVAAVAAGMVLERATTQFHRDLFHDVASYPRWVQYGIYLTEFGDPFCTGITLVEGAVLWIEACRRRAARIWGFGRLTWSVSFCVAVLMMLKMLIWVPAREMWDGVLPDMRLILHHWTEYFDSAQSEILIRSGVPLVLISLLMTSLVARWPRDPSPDAREWTGRIFCGALVLLYLTHEVLGWYWE